MIRFSTDKVAVAYRIEYAIASTNNWIVAGTATTTPYVVSSLTNKISYKFRVTGISRDNDTSPVSLSTTALIGGISWILNITIRVVGQFADFLF